MRRASGIPTMCPLTKKFGSGFRTARTKPRKTAGKAGMLNSAAEKSAGRIRATGISRYFMKKEGSYEMNIRTYRTAGFAGLLAGIAAFGAMVFLKVLFGYPDIIRAEPAVILHRLAERIGTVPLVYYFGIGMSGVLMGAFYIHLYRIARSAGDEDFAPYGCFCGATAGTLLFVGILRYAFLFPLLALQREANPGNAVLIENIFYAMNMYVGNSVAEHAQFIFSGIALYMMGRSILRYKYVPAANGYFALVGSFLLFYGSAEPFGLPLAFAVNRIASAAMVLWLFFMGAAFLRKRSDPRVTSAA